MTLIVTGLVLALPGVLAVTGRWQGWSESTVLHWPFGLAWAGPGLVLVGAGGLIGDTGREFVALRVQDIGLTGCVIGIVGAFWLPRVLLPRWYREAKGLGPRRARMQASVDPAPEVVALPDPVLPSDGSTELRGAGWRSWGDDHVSISVPDTWDVVPVGPGHTATAEPARRDGGRRATVSVVHRESDETLSEAASRLATPVTGSPTRMHLVADETWVLPGVDARMLDHLSWEGDDCVSVTTWVVVAGRRTVEVTARVGLLDRVGYDDLLLAMAARLVVVTAGQSQPSPDADGTGALRRPATLATGDRGHQLGPDGVGRLSATAWDQLFSWRHRGLLSRRPHDASEAVELRGLGWIDDLGDPTGLGRDLVELRARASMSFRGESRSSGATTTWFAWIDGDRAVVAAEPSNLDRASSPSDGSVTVHLTSTGSALGLMIAWTGLAPSRGRADDVRAGDISADALGRRVDEGPGGASLGGADADWAATRAWTAGQWTWFRLGSGVTHRATQVIRAGDLGWVRPRTGDGPTARLDPILPGDVMREVLTVWRDSLEADSSD